MAYVIPTLHPAHILRGAPLTDVIRTDLEKALRVADWGPYQPENLIIVHPSNPIGLEQITKTAIAWLQYWRSIRCKVAIDVETSSLEFMSTRLYSIAISGVDGNYASVAFTLEDLHTLPWSVEAALTYELRLILEDPTITKVYHNAPFDYAVLKQHGYTLRGQIVDTMACAHLIQPDAPKDLGWIGHLYLDVEPWKIEHDGQKKAHTSDIINLLIYNAKDALNTGKLVDPLQQEMACRNVTSEMYWYQMEMARIAAEMEVYGLPFNPALRNKMKQEMEQEVLGYLSTLRDMLNWPDFNPNSPTHAVEAIYGNPAKSKYNVAGIIPTSFTEKTGAPSTSYKSDLIDYIDHPLVRVFVDYKEARSAYSTIFKDKGDTTIDSKGKPGAYSKCIYGNRLHVKWNPVQVANRWTSQPNIQNIKKKYRPIFEASFGRVFVGADSDQVELRILMCKAGVREMVEEINKPNSDPHTLAASVVYGEEFWKRTPAERKILRTMVKTVEYASFYGAAPKRVWRTVRERKELDSKLRAKLTIDEVIRIHKRFFGRFVEVPAYHQRNYEEVCRLGYDQADLLGWRRYYPVLPPPFTEVANWRTQFFNAMLTGMTIVHIQHDLDKETKGDAHVVIHGHDAIYVECKESYAERAKFLMQYHFGDNIIDGPAGPVHLTSEAKIGKNIKEVG